MITLSQIAITKECISKMTADQVENGLQSETLPPECKACGQFFLKNKKHRGIHGTSAAIRVLGGAQNQNYNHLLPQLVNYLTQRNNIDEFSGQVNIKNNYPHDQKNIIKISEQLYSLSYVKHANADISILFEKLQTSLISCTNSKKVGWSYFTDDLTNDPEILPTSFAVMALNSHGKNVEKEVEYIINYLKPYSEKDFPDPTTFAISVFALYVITKINTSIKNKFINEVELKKLFKKIWKSQFCILDDNIEQDVDYWSKDDDDFSIKVPWQLYMLAMSSIYSPLSFCKTKSQKILSSIYQSIEEGNGFKYKYSSRYISVRTNSIVFDTFSVIQKNYHNQTLFTTYHLYDKLRIFFGQPWFRQLIIGVFYIVTVYTIYLWLTSTGHLSEKLKELGPHTLVIILVFLYDFGKKK